MSRSKLKKYIIVVIIIILIGILTLTLHTNYNIKYYTSLEELNSEKIGVSTGSTFDTLVNKKLKNIDIKYYDSVIDMITALRNGKIATYITDEAMANETIKNNGDLVILNDPVGIENYAYAINPNNQDLKKQIDQVLLELKKDGTLNYLEKKWMGNDDTKKYLENINLSGKNGTIKFGTLATSAPFSYLKNNKIVGYDIDLMMLTCDK